jgi:hypothetical protein
LPGRHSPVAAAIQPARHSFVVASLNTWSAEPTKLDDASQREVDGMGRRRGGVSRTEGKGRAGDKAGGAVIRETRDFTRAGGEPLEMKAFLRMGPIDESVYYALAGRGSPRDSLRMGSG